MYDGTAADQFPHFEVWVLKAEGRSLVAANIQLS
jgi:hypothetical protein